MSIESAMNLNKYLGEHVKNGGRYLRWKENGYGEMVDVCSINVTSCDH